MDTLPFKCNKTLFSLEIKLIKREKSVFILPWNVFVSLKPIYFWQREKLLHPTYLEGKQNFVNKLDYEKMSAMAKSTKFIVVKF